MSDENTVNMQTDEGLQRYLCAKGMTAHQYQSDL